MPDFVANANGRSRVAKTLPTSCEQQGATTCGLRDAAGGPTPRAPSGARQFVRKNAQAFCTYKLWLAYSANDASCGVLGETRRVRRFGGGAAPSLLANTILPIFAHLCPSLPIFVRRCCEVSASVRCEVRTSGAAKYRRVFAAKCGRAVLRSIGECSLRSADERCCEVSASVRCEVRTMEGKFLVVRYSERYVGDK
jgi:hypothetical protein